MSMDYFNAFWFGGLVCALIQILLDKTKLMPGRVMVLLVCSGALLSAVGIYRPLVDFAGAGASVPLIGFGHVLWEGMKKAIEEDGILGLFTGGFTACAAGVSSAATAAGTSRTAAGFNMTCNNRCIDKTVFTSSDVEVMIPGIRSAVHCHLRLCLKHHGNDRSRSNSQ